MTIKKGTVTIASEVPATDWGSIEGTLSDQTDLQNALNAKASTLSPSFTGIPTVPLAEEGTDNNQIASTKFVNTAIDNALDGANVLPDQTGQAGKVLTTDGSNASWTNYESAPSVDNVTTTLNSSDEIQAIGVIEKNTSSVKYDWVGTYAQWVAGRENHTILDSWICYITDDVVETKVAHNIGDVFYSLRLDDYLNGAVACDGSSYNTEDYSEGAQSIKNLLDSDKLPYVSISDFDATVTAKGSCRCFGYDGGSTFKVPKLNDVFIECGSANTDNEFIDAGLPNITGDVRGALTNADGATGGSGAFSGSNVPSGAEKIFGYRNDSQHYVMNLNLNASNSNSIYGNSDTVQPDAVKYRAFIQLVTGVSENAIQTIDILADDVDDLKDEIKETLQYKNITNCITEIPQDIKLELNDGVLTLKAGSKVYVPNGFEQDGTTPKFDEVILENDISNSDFHENTVQVLLYVRNGGQYFDWRTSRSSHSGSSDPQTAGTHYYDTSTNILTCWFQAGGSARDSLPIALITLDNGVCTSIDQVFNGFGYIGNKVFGLPGVKALIPNGRNEDGTLKNIDFTLNNVSISFNSGISRDGIYIFGDSDTYHVNRVHTSAYYYDEENNYNKTVEGDELKFNVLAGTTEGDITSINLRHPFHTVDYNDVEKIKQEVEQKQDSATAVSYKNITNCITEIPQDIKLELNEGVLTLKAGSKVYIPNGFEQDETTPHFDEYIIPNDFITDSINANQTNFHFWNVTQGYFGRGAMNKITSSPTAPSNPSNYSFWYNTTDNIIKRYVDNAWTSDIFSLPVCLATMDDTKYTSIDQVFNGFGYIGSTLFALPGVKGLIPNGRNDDGTLNNRAFSYTDVTTYTGSGTHNYLVRCGSNYLNAFPDSTYYDQNKNEIIYNGNKQNQMIAGKFSLVDSQVTSLDVKQAYHALDYNDKSSITGWSLPSTKYIDLTLGATASNYIAPANGWFFLTKNVNAANQYIELGDPTNDIAGIRIRTYCPASSGLVMAYIPVHAGHKIYITYNAGGSVGHFRFVYAQGEV